jgi:hypothetical protein
VTAGSAVEASAVSWSAVFAMGFVAMIALPVVLLKLFYFHDYYVVEVVPYLVLAVAAALANLHSRRTTLGVAAMCVTVLVSISTYVVAYAAREASHPAYSSELVSYFAKTDPDEIVVIRDAEISVSWVIDRRSMLVSDFKTPGALSGHIVRVEREGYRVSSVLTRKAPARVQAELHSLGFKLVRNLEYDIWSRKG